MGTVPKNVYEVLFQEEAGNVHSKAFDSPIPLRTFQRIPAKRCERPPYRMN